MGEQEPDQKPAARDSVLEQIRARRKATADGHQKDFVVPRWGEDDDPGPRMCVTYRTIDKDWIDEANEKVLDLETGRTVTAYALVLARAVVRVFAIAESGEELTLSNHFDQELAEALGVDGEVTGAVDTALALYSDVDGDLMSAFDAVYTWSGYQRDNLERELQGNSSATPQ